MSDFIDLCSTAIWRASWQGGLLVLVIWSVCYLWPSMPIRAQSWLWRLAILKFVVALCLPAVVDVPLLSAESTVAEDTLFAKQNIASTDFERFVPSNQPSNLHSSWLIPLALWACVVGWRFIRFHSSYLESRAMLRRCQAVRSLPIVQQFARVSSSFGLLKPPRLLVTDGDSSPMLIGLLSPAIVLPRETLHRLDQDELEIVMAHELAHFRRADLCWNTLAYIAGSLFFFHPLAWIAQRRLALVQEIAADDLAIKVQCDDPSRYGNLLLSVVTKLGPTQFFSATSVETAGGKESLRERLAAMRYLENASRQSVAKCVALLCTIVIVGVIPWRGVAAGPNNEPDNGQKANAQPKPTHMAKVKISEGSAKKKSVVMTPVIKFIAGQKSVLKMEGKDRYVEMSVVSDTKKTPIRHAIKVEIVDDPQTKSRLSITTQRIVLLDETVGKTAIGLTDGNELEFEVSVGIDPGKNAEGNARKTQEESLKR